MRVIPVEKLPAGLKQVVQLSNIKAIRYEATTKLKTSHVGSIFFKKYGPTLKFHNQGLEVTRTLSSSLE